MPYQHILVATDGSALSAPAIRVAVKLAKALGARLTCLHVLAGLLLGSETTKVLTHSRIPVLVCR